MSTRVSTGLLPTVVPLLAALSSGTTSGSTGVSTSRGAQSAHTEGTPKSQVTVKPQGHGDVTQGHGQNKPHDGDSHRAMAAVVST